MSRQEKATEQKMLPMSSVFAYGICDIEKNINGKE